MPLSKTASTMLEYVWASGRFGVGEDPEYPAEMRTLRSLEVNGHIVRHVHAKDDGMPFSDASVPRYYSPDGYSERFEVSCAA